MSLILEALKKSEAERRLGEIPNLGSVAVWAPRRKRSVLWWALIPLAAVTSAALWSNRELFSRKSTRDDMSLSSTAISKKIPAKPPASITTEEQKTATGNAKPLSSAVVKNTNKPAVTEKPALIKNNHLGDQRAKPIAQGRKNPGALQDLSGRDRKRSDSGKSPAAPSSAKSTPTTTDNIQEIPIPQTAQPNHPNSAMAPSSEVASSGAVSPSTTLPITANPNNLRSTGNTSTLTFYDLTLGQREGLPELKMSMHVYHQDPARRFAIIDGKRLNQGGAIGTELFVRDIVPNGVVFEYRGIRFLLPRVGS